VGQDDTNSNTTRRILLLLESVALGQGAAHERVITGTLSRYLLEERTFARGSKPINVPRFCSTISPRYWRTMAVDFAYKSRTRHGERQRAPEPQATDVAEIDLRFWSAVVFQLPAGHGPGGRTTLGCPGREEECVICLARLHGPQAARHLRADRLYLAEKNPAKAAQIFAFAEKAVTAYDKFLAILADTHKRERLDNLAQADIDSDPLFVKPGRSATSFRDGIDGFFFDGDADLAKLTRHYGVFDASL